MTKRLHNLHNAYLIALIAVLAAFALRWMISPYVKEASPRLLLVFGVAVAARWGGFGPGIFATVAGAILGSYFVPDFEQRIAGGDLEVILSAAIFLFVGFLICWITADMQRARVKAEHAAAAARQNWEELSQSDRRFQSLAHHLVAFKGRFDARYTAAHQAAYRWDPVTDKLQATPELLNWLAGSDPPQSLAQWLEQVHPDDRALLGEHLREVAQGRTQQVVVYRLRKEPGGYTSIEQRSFAFASAAGSPAEVIGVCTDTAARLNMETAFQDAQALLAG